MSKKINTKNNQSNQKISIKAQVELTNSMTNFKVKRANKKI